MQGLRKNLHFFQLYVYLIPAYIKRKMYFHTNKK